MKKIHTNISEKEWDKNNLNCIQNSKEWKVLR